jgi:riboflavin kinase / FMN adenylyltransferase
VKVLHDVDELPAGLRFVLAIGTFDGVHRGHVRVIESLTAAARDLDAEPVALTFDPHPAAVLRGNPPPLLCDLAERLDLLDHLGVGITVVQNFNARFAEQSGEEFIVRVRRGRQLLAMVMTAESAFGRDRSAGLPAVRSLAGRLDFRAIEVPRLASTGDIVSSTTLRRLLTEGRLSDVRRLLGRRYAVVGTVVKGDQRGRTLGYPTANLHFESPVALPRDGIYAVRVAWGGDDRGTGRRQRRLGVASLGVRPTFNDGGARILEVHVFDFDGDLYGQQLRVEFVRRLRGEKRFASAPALVRQMDRDAARARKVLDELETANG